jgi:uncharacterized membrane protein
MLLDLLSPDTLLRKSRNLLRQLWLRVVIMGLLAFVALGLAQIIEIFVPARIGSQLTGAAADRLLHLIATAMLAVTTFSLTVMVTVYRATSDQFTPRVHQLIMQDSTTQNTLAAFIGAYVYALVAIVLREFGIFIDDRALVLFVMTVLVLTFVVYSLIRWVLHLQTFGSLLDTTRQVEEITRAQFRERLETPCLGALPWAGAVPERAAPHRAWKSGYVQHIYPEALNAAAKRHGLELFLTSSIGSFVHLNEPLVMAVAQGDAEEGCDDDTLLEALQETIILGDVRTYDQDPRLGLLVMGEIGSKALSPGINDPGTAIDVITRATRILSAYRDETVGEEAPRYKRLHVRPLDADDLLEDAFAGIARDGAGVIEVQQRLQSSLAALARHPDQGLCRAARRRAAISFNRAMQAFDFEEDRNRLQEKTSDEVVELTEN